MDLPFQHMKVNLALLTLVHLPLSGCNVTYSASSLLLYVRFQMFFHSVAMSINAGCVCV